YLQINKYSEKYKGLDVTPKGEFSSDDTSFYTKGSTGNGFDIVLSGTTYSVGKATATRKADGKTGQENGLNYNYELSRYYASDLTQCDGADDNGKALCADFCGIDTPANTCCSDGSSAACATPGTGNETETNP
ncbi:hypothetical protein, partial [Candidatus Avelusimicrobium stercoris]|uniref:hypothetical protein n=1 Tax=Candidatus Avelusimicrobium stercoris TaxID=1947924 RepID=UPI003D144102